MEQMTFEQAVEMERIPRAEVLSEPPEEEGDDSVNTPDDVDDITEDDLEDADDLDDDDDDE